MMVDQLCTYMYIVYICICTNYYQCILYVYECKGIMYCYVFILVQGYTCVSQSSSYILMLRADCERLKANNEIGSSIFTEELLCWTKSDRELLGSALVPYQESGCHDYQGQ